MEVGRQKERFRTYSQRLFILSLLVIFFTGAGSYAQAHKNIQQELKSLAKIHGSFTFAVLGDNRSAGKEYSTIIARAMEHKPAFIVNTGDMILAANRAKWTDFLEKSKAVTVPYFLTVGNHDVRTKESERLYKDEVDLPGNELYYSFDAGNSLFVVLDSNIPEQDREIRGDQYKWLEQVLSSSRQMHKFVFIHHPLYPDQTKGHHYGESLDLYPKERDRLEKLFEKFHVTIVFAGHEHLYLRKMVDGIMHVITGGGGAPLYTENDKGGFHHFILVKVDGEKIIGQVIDDRGIVRDSFRL